MLNYHSRSVSGQRQEGDKTVFVSLYRFQSEKETGDRNYAIGYYLKDKKVRKPGGWGEKRD